MQKQAQLTHPLQTPASSCSSFEFIGRLVFIDAHFSLSLSLPRPVQVSLLESDVLDQVIASTDTGLILAMANSFSCGSRRKDYS